MAIILLPLLGLALTSLVVLLNKDGAAEKALVSIIKNSRHSRALTNNTEEIDAVINMTMNFDPLKVGVSPEAMNTSTETVRSERSFIDMMKEFRDEINKTVHEDLEKYGITDLKNKLVQGAIIAVDKMFYSNGTIMNHTVDGDADKTGVSTEEIRAEKNQTSTEKIRLKRSFADMMKKFGNKINNTVHEDAEKYGIIDMKNHVVSGAQKAIKAVDKVLYKIKTDPLYQRPDGYKPKYGMEDEEYDNSY